MLLADFNQEQEQRRSSLRYRFFARFWLLVIVILLAIIALAFYHRYKPLALGLDSLSQSYIVNESDINFLSNHSSSTPTGFESLLFYIDSAQQYILLDTYVFNDWSSGEQTKYSAQLIDKLLAKKAQSPDIKIDLIIDPFNLGYGALDDSALKAMSSAGINVIISNLSPLRDSNLFYSPFWRLFISWWDFLPDYPWLANPWQAGAPKVTLRSYLAALNFKSNQRQLFIADHQGQLVSLFGLDLAGPSSAPILTLRGPLAEAIYQSESVVAKLSNASLYSLPSNLLAQSSPESNHYVRLSLATESQIKAALLSQIQTLKSGDNLQIASPVLADQDLIQALISSASRGTKIQILLSKHPASLVSASELLSSKQDSISLLFSTQELSGTLFLAESPSDHQLVFISSSANLTRRALDNYNLSSALLMTLNTDWSLAPLLKNQFDSLWSVGAAHQPSDKLNWWRSTFIRFQSAAGLANF